MSLTPGANLPVPTALLRAVLSWRSGPGGPDIDASALLLGPSGRVRDDADLVFYNQPRHVSGAVDHAGKDGDSEILTDVLDVDLAAKPVFWQFVGLGPVDFTRFATLDTMRVRKVDNCGFVTVHDPDRTADARFYDLLLAEFPRWLIAARAKGVVPA